VLLLDTESLQEWLGNSDDGAGIRPNKWAMPPCDNAVKNTPFAKVDLRISRLPHFNSYSNN